jgi:hypothetical protein
MVMRKFKKPEENGSNPLDGSLDDLANPLIGLNSPRITRRNRGGSFSGQTVQDPPNAGYDSPSVRRRRSRIPSEEDDKLVMQYKMCHEFSLKNEMTIFESMLTTFLNFMN